MLRSKTPTKVKFFVIALCFATAVVRSANEKIPWFYDPVNDPIPYTPGKNRFGAAYEIPPSPWKKAADRRIDTYRKADLTIRVVDKQGTPLKDVPIHVKLKRHEFYWGAVINSDFLNGDHSNLLKFYFLKYFNSSGFNMGLKPKSCAIKPCRKSYKSLHFYKAEKQILWMREHDIPVRGHTLAWEGKRFLAKHLLEIYENPALSDGEKGRRMFALNARHIDHAVKKWDVFCWDVVNEPRMNHLINDLFPGTNTFVEWFRLADQARKKYKRNFLMFYNENQLASFVKKKSSFEEYSRNYKARIQEILDAGVPLDGIGMQYRFRRYVAPEKVYRRLCAFEEFKLPFQATEFELKPMETESFSAEDRKKMTAELLTVFFSHPNAMGLWHWSFMDDKDGSSPQALFSYDGQPRPEGEQWIKMMEEDFNTDETVCTDVNGTVTVRGFKGIYKITLGLGPQAKNAFIILKDKTRVKIVY